MWQVFDLIAGKDKALALYCIVYNPTRTRPPV
jgi:hypothetical protein